MNVMSVHQHGADADGGLRSGSGSFAFGGGHGNDGKHDKHDNSTGNQQASVYPITTNTTDKVDDLLYQMLLQIQSSLDQ